MPALSISSVMTCDVKAEPLSVMMCFGTYACFVKMSNRASTTDFVSGLRIGMANRYRRK